MIIRDPGDIDDALAGVAKAATAAAGWVGGKIANPLELLYHLKFSAVGFNPAAPDAAMNLVEQVNQTWSLVAALEAARVLLERHPEAGGFALAPGAHAAQPLDLMSVAPDLVGAEIFAAVSPANNGKLLKDLARMSGRPEQHRYVIFLSPRYPSTARHPRLERNGVQVWSVAAPRWLLKCD